MEIYKLKDEVRVRRYGDEAAEEGVRVILRITDIRQGVKNPNRVNVYVNERFSFSLDIAQIVDLGIKVGLIISEEQLEEFKKASEFGKAYQRALEWVLMRPRSVRELRDYLKRRERTKEMEERRREWADNRSEKEWDNDRDEEKPRKSSRKVKYDFNGLIIERLTEKGYVNDLRFAEYYAENRFVKKGVSRRRLEMELMKKGITREIIEEVLAKRNDEEEILKIIAKKRAKYTDEKLVAYLVRQGFSFELARKLVTES